MLWGRSPTSWPAQRQTVVSIRRVNGLGILSSDVGYESRVKANVPDAGQVKAEWDCCGRRCASVPRGYDVGIASREEVLEAACAVARSELGEVVVERRTRGRGGSKLEIEIEGEVGR